MGTDCERQYQDPAEYSSAKCHDHPDRRPGQYGFMRQFVSDYNIDPEDMRVLDEYIKQETDKMLSERLLRLIEFCESCNIPKLVVFSTLITDGSMKMTDIAKQCGVSKQAVHKAFRQMEPAFKPYGDGFERRRQFLLQKPNENTKSTR